MQRLMKSSRFVPSSLSLSAPNLQVSIFCSLVAADAGVATSRAGSRQIRLKVFSIGIAPLAVRRADLIARYGQDCDLAQSRLMTRNRPVWAGQSSPFMEQGAPG